jgi:hypothetical protein
MRASTLPHFDAPWPPCPGCVVTALAGLPLCCPPAAQWKWRDASGRVTASDRPPRATCPTRTSCSAPAAQPVLRTGGGTAPPRPAAASGAPRPRRTRNWKPASAPPNRSRRPRPRPRNSDWPPAAPRTAAARAAPGHAGSGQRIARVNDKGEREVLDDKGRADESAARARSSRPTAADSAGIRAGRRRPPCALVALAARLLGVDRQRAVDLHPVAVAQRLVQRAGPCTTRRHAARPRAGRGAAARRWPAARRPRWRRRAAQRRPGRPPGRRAVDHLDGHATSPRRLSGGHTRLRRAARRSRRRCWPRGRTPG